MTTKKETESKVVAIKNEINMQLGDAETMNSLLATTFKGFEAPLMKRALLEGMLRGFSFTEFLNKDVFAIPYGETYSLVTSIDRARKIGARSGVVGVAKPTYEYDNDGRLLSCAITVKKRFPDGYIGDFEAEVDFKEYSTGKNLWSSKPKTMISKVAEMHALRKACPEELAQSYVEEEFERQPMLHMDAIDLGPAVDAEDYRLKLHACQTLGELERVWADIPGDAKRVLETDRDAVKKMIMSEAKTTID